MKNHPDAKRNHRWGYFRLALLSFGLCVVVIFAILHFVFNAHVARADFKSFAESKIGEAFKAKVHIRSVQASFFNEVAFTDLDVEPDTLKPSPYRVRIQKVVFHYNLWQLLTRNIKMPSSVVLDAPEIAIPGEGFPYGILDRLSLGQGDASIAGLEMDNGFIRYEIPNLQAVLELRGVRGSFKPYGVGKLRLDFHAYVSGFANGEVDVQGDVDLIQKTHDLRLDLHSVDFGSKIPIPLETLVGKMRWVNDNFFFDEIQAVIHGWDVEIRGSLERLVQSPALTLHWQVGERKPSVRGNFRADLASQSMHGEIYVKGQPDFIFDGKVRQEDMRYVFDALRVNDDYDGQGWFDFKSGDYRLKFEKERQSVSIVSNLNGLDFEMNLNLNHVKLYGVDLVTSARIRLMPYRKPLKKKVWKFKGAFATDYFILEYIPFYDFKGEFEITPDGIRNFNGSWGNVFNMLGTVSFRKQPFESKFMLNVNGFDLGNVQTFASKPLPKALGGILEGKLKLDGPLNHPEVVGHFTIRNGILGRLEYDRGYIQLRGIAPYLRLYDSKILKGRTTFSLEGAIDMSLANMFHGVEIRKPDKYVIWKGWEANTNQGEGDVEVGRPLLPTFSLRAGGNSSENIAPDNKDKEDDKYLVVGPKFKF
ncbi:MAG: hypothetical protein PHN49_09540 [Candidatus Omnitrophica bacterium]|nr:hypothetical protein [Candidatus Omnitrophota bacterium]MDD5671870.1 hypothetical protein [Candidatus Omnitrophota bacterium]